MTVEEEEELEKQINEIRERIKRGEKLNCQKPPMTEYKAPRDLHFYQHP